MPPPTSLISRLTGTLLQHHMTDFTLAFFSRFRAVQNGQPVAALSSNRAEELLCYLVLSGKRQHDRAALAAFFWPDLPEPRAAAALRQALYLLQSRLTDQPACPRLLNVSRNEITIDLTAVSVDVLYAEALIAQTTRHRHRTLQSCPTCMQALEQATAAVSGMPLHSGTRGSSSAFVNWRNQRIAQLVQQLSTAFAVLSAAALRRNATQQAVAIAQRWCELDPLHEPAQRALMRALTVDGRQADALKHFRTLRRNWSRDQGTDVSPQTLLLATQIRSGKLPQPAAAALPLSTPQLFGREHERAQIAGLLTDPQVRLINLTGIGGIGKTSLALACAAEHAPAFTDGVVFVALEHVSDANRMIEAIVTAVGMHVDAGRPILSQLIASIQQKDMLLILDNLEQINDAETLISHLHDATLQPVFLTTSRRILNLRCEYVLPLDGLALPTAGHHERDNAAIALFLNRADVVTGTRDWDAELSDIGEIVRACAGVPLALELAAYQVRFRSCHEIAALLAGSLPALQTSSTDLPLRQHSLALIVAETWQHLPQPVQQVLATLTVLHGPFRPELPAALCSTATGADRAEVDDALRTAQSYGVISRSGEQHFSLHPLVRRFLTTLPLFSAEQRAALHERHAAVMFDLLTAADLRFVNEHSVRWAAAERLLIDELIAAWQHDSRHANNERLRRAAYPLAIAAAAGNWTLRYDDLLHETLSTSAAVTDQRLRRRLLAVRAFLFNFHMNQLRVQRVLAELLTEPLPEPLSADHVLGLRTRSEIALFQRDFAAALHDAQRSFVITADDEVPAAVTSPDQSLSRWYAACGERAPAEKHGFNALVLVRRNGNQRAEVSILNELALLPARAGDFAGSVQRLSEALELARKLNDVAPITVLLANLGNARQLAGQDLDRALSELSEAAELARHSELRGYLRLALAGLARITHLLGQHQNALPYQREVLLIDSEIGLMPSSAEVVVHHAESLSAVGRHAMTAALIDYAVRLPSLSADLRERAAALAQPGMHPLPNDGVTATAAELRRLLASLPAI